MMPVSQARALSYSPAKLFEGSVLLLGAEGALAGDCRAMLESGGYSVLQAADVEEAAALLGPRSDVMLVVICRAASIDDDILAARAIKASSQAPWVEYVILSASAAAVPEISISDQEAESIVPAADRDRVLSALAEAFNLARLARHQADEASDLERALQEFRSRTEMAMSQLLSRARGRLSAGRVAEEEAGATAEDVARAMEEERSRARIREKFFGAFRLGHAGWMLMLVLAEMQGVGNELTVKSAAYAAGLPLSSALRKINEMCEDGLLHRRSDPSDSRRSFVMLSERARTLLGEYLGAVRRASRAP